MILTPVFVFVCNPKTGSTTAEDILYHAAKLEEQSMSTLTVIGKMILVKLGIKKPLIRRFLGHGTKNMRHKHANVAQIPKGYKNLPIITTFRNPQTWILSHIRYGDPSHIAINILGDNAPPNTTDEKIHVYLRYVETLRKRHDIDDPSIGYFTIHFIMQMHPEPGKQFKALNANQHLKFEEFSRIHFLSFENQSNELIHAIKQYGYCPNQIFAIDRERHLNRSDSASTEKDAEAIRSYLEKHEPILLSLHEEYQNNLVQ